MPFGGRIASRAIGTTLAACCALALTATGASAAPTDAWPSDTAGGAGSSYNPGESVITARNARDVRSAWTNHASSGGRTAPTIVDGLVYRVASTSSAGSTSPFEVRSARTGKLLWSIPLPRYAFYAQGVTVVPERRMAVVSFDGSGGPDGVLAVDLVRKRVAWKKSLPADRYSWDWDPRGATTAISDGTRVFVSGSDNAVNTFRLADGARLWTVPLKKVAPSALESFYGAAVAGGRLYVGTSSGLSVYDAATGIRRWTAPGAGHPLVAGGRVFVARANGVTAVSASGCGRSTCPALWNRTLGDSKTSLPGSNHDAPRIGGASSSTLFASYVTGEDGMDERGVVVRLSASTGAVQWSATTLEDPGIPSRGGDVVWLIANPGPNGPGERSVVAFPASGSSREPLVSLKMPRGSGFYGGIAVSGGTVVAANMAGPLLAYRVPGT